MNKTDRQTHKEYIKILKKMKPQARLQKAFELSDLTKNLFITGLRMRYPDYSEEDIKDLYIEKIYKCHSSDY
ncbi:MAG: hypothetical protein KAI62_09120 [Actinomycetia bacterium]|nr:hypothetical protein [Actinomycetes bacterium]